MLFFLSIIYNNRANDIHDNGIIKFGKNLEKLAYLVNIDLDLRYYYFNYNFLLFYNKYMQKWLNLLEILGSSILWVNKRIVKSFLDNIY